jgi:hypothetical protein
VLAALFHVGLGYFEDIIKVDREVWKTEPDGQSSAQVLGLKLVVRKYDSCGGTCAQVMLSSGTEPNPNAVMVAAERATTTTVYMLSERRR